MGKAKKIKSFAEFKPTVQDYTITNPENADEFTIELRPLTPKELTELNAGIRRPKPKIKGFKGKDQWGQPIPDYDEEDPQYVKDLALANQEFVYAWLIACSAVEIPGTTQEEKVKFLQENIPNWVFIEIQRKLQEIQGYRQADVVYQKKKLAMTQQDT
jgi:hypothetical protein